MFSLKIWLMFLAGAAFFNTLSHIFVPYYIELPLPTKNYTLTQQINNYIIAGSAALTILLLFLAAKAK